MLKFALIIPTLNGGECFRSLLESIAHQTIQPEIKLLIDSGSTDNTMKLAYAQGFKIVEIKKNEFNHGATRQMGVDLVEDIYVIVFMTQDAILFQNDAFEKLLECFRNSNVGIAYGRQIPHRDEGPFGSHARLFNYPENNNTKSIKNSPQMGIKTAFISNSFAAYRRSTLVSIGGFPSNTILGEDMYVAAKLLLSGGEITYCADAIVFHSHHYSWLEEFRRYFDTGVFHARESWIKKSFGKAEGEGLKFVHSELAYLWRNKWFMLIPLALLRTVGKFIGYKLGLHESKLPLQFKKACSMHRLYWGN